MSALKYFHVEFFIIITLIILGSFFRLYDLGEPGFWGDEETSSIPAKSLALGGEAVFPSGMEYRRALPHTYLNALAAKIYGTEKDLSYRISSSAFGIATLILIFFFTRNFFGLQVALVATALLAFSEWHIILSRTARMYGPLLFFSLSFCIAALSWHFKSKNNLYLILACILFLAASTFNYLVIIVLPILFIPVIFQPFDKGRFSLSLVSTLILGTISTIYLKSFLSTPYREIEESRLSPTIPTSNESPEIVSSITNLLLNNYTLIFISLIFGSLVFVKTRKYFLSKNLPLITISYFIAILSVVAFLLYGNVYGALICSIYILLLLSNSSNVNHGFTLTYIYVIAITIAITTTFNILNFGFINGIKESLNYPFPYLLYQFSQYPGVIILFAVGIIEAALMPINKQNVMIKVLIVVVILPSFMLGLIKDWAPPRYLITTYPIILIVSAYGFICLINRIPLLKDSKILKLSFITFVPASGLLGGHGIPQSIKVSPSQYGTNIYSNHLSGIGYPDHRSHGCFVKEQLLEGDIVVAEDALQMYWYIEHVDYWLRTPSNIDKFLYLDDDNQIKDRYVNSMPTTNEVIRRLSNTTDKRIWVITSGETQQHIDHFLVKGSPQRAWLDKLAETHTPILNGRDGLSATYCLNCDYENKKFNAWNYDCK
jgi:hypothetical protein